MHRLAIAALLTVFAVSARADQCWWLTREQAERAASVLQPGAEFVEYCEPCRDRPPTYARTVGSSSAGNIRVAPGRPADPSGWAVTVNGQERDIAYLYVLRGTRWENVAMVAGCPVHDVNPTFSFPPGVDASGQGAAGGPTTRCTIRSDRALVFNGPCRFEVQPGGSFSVSTAAPRGPLFLDVVMVSVSIVSPGEADVRGLTTSGVNSRWGEAKRSKIDPACWTGSDFEVCARRVSAGR